MKKEEEQFLRVYKRTLDPGEAFLAAGFLPEKGETPEEAGKKKLRKFRSKLRTLEKREEKMDEPSLERIKAEIARIAFNDIGRYLSFSEGENGFEVHCKPSSEIDTRSISEVAVGTGGKVTLKLYSKERALFKLWEIVSGEDPEIPGGGDIFDMLKSGENE